MPIYEYRCADCSKVTSIFVRSASTTVEATCEHCGSTAVSRMVSKVARLKTDSDVLEDYGGEGIQDPRQIGRWVEKRFEDYGMELPSETREAIDRARSGELPKAIDDL
jgi:putative FmdB family regulatory protein